MSIIDKHYFFSISFEFVTVGEPMLYDLYINSSGLEGKERFVRIFPRGGSLERDDVIRFRNKYHQLYVLEEQRDMYLRSLIKNQNVPNIKKAEVIKDTAIQYLDTIFSDDRILDNEMLEDVIHGCRDSVEVMVEVVQDYSINDIQELIGNLSFHDFYTYDHSINVSMYNISIFKTMKPNAKKEELVLAGMSGLLHDLGKMSIPTHIINNPGKLTDEEFEIIKSHPQAGRDLVEKQVKNIVGLDLEVIKRVIFEHHENFNGTGYPGNKSGKDIHIFARITAIADFYDAITTKRSYHKILSTDEAISVMSKSVGKKIDPDIFDVLAKNAKKLVTTGDPKMVLPDDFDPCQPHRELPFEEFKPHKQEHDLFGKNDEKTFGSVKVNSIGLTCDHHKSENDHDDCDSTQENTTTHNQNESTEEDDNCKHTPLKKVS